MIIRLEDASGEPYTASELSKLVNFIELFCYLVREKGGLDNIRASLQAFEMRHDGTIQREWLEGTFRLCFEDFRKLKLRTFINYSGHSK